jgi:hypothetical protein
MDDPTLAFVLAGSRIRGPAVRPGAPFACDRHEMRHESACQHRPQCPGASARDRAAACVVASHPEQGWSLLCNGIVLFDDAGVLVLAAPVAIPGHAPALPRAA